MKLLDVLKSALAQKKGFHRTPSNTKRGRQLVAASTKYNIQPGTNGAKIEPRDSRESIKGTVSKRDI